MPARKIGEKEIETIKRMTMEGYTHFDIADKIGVSKTTVGYYQKKLNLKASNKWHFGETASKEPLQLKEEKPPKPKKKWTTVADKKITLTGNQTNYVYEFGLTESLLKIKTGYSDDIMVDLKDLAAFCEELCDVTEAINELKKHSKE